METKGLTCKIPLELHQQIREEQERLGMTMNQYMEMIVTEHFTPKGENKTMGKTRTLAFQISEELFEKVKEYLSRYEQAYGRKITQKEFVISLIENALDEAEDDFAALEADGEYQEETAQIPESEAYEPDADGEGEGEEQPQAGYEAPQAPESETDEPDADGEGEGGEPPQAGHEAPQTPESETGEPDADEIPDGENGTTPPYAWMGR